LVIGLKTGKQGFERRKSRLAILALLARGSVEHHHHGRLRNFLLRNIGHQAEGIVGRTLMLMSDQSSRLGSLPFIRQCQHCRQGQHGHQQQTCCKQTILTH
jgi:hypothetical protein